MKMMMVSNEIDFENALRDTHCEGQYVLYKVGQRDSLLRVVPSIQGEIVLHYNPFFERSIAGDVSDAIKRALPKAKIIDVSGAKRTEKMFSNQGDFSIFSREQVKPEKALDQAVTEIDSYLVAMQSSRVAEAGLFAKRNTAVPKTKSQVVSSSKRFKV